MLISACLNKYVGSINSARSRGIKAKQVRIFSKEAIYDDTQNLDNKNIDEIPTLKLFWGKSQWADQG